MAWGEAPGPLRRAQQDKHAVSQHSPSAPLLGCVPKLKEKVDRSCIDHVRSSEVSHQSVPSLTTEKKVMRRTRFQQGSLQINEACRWPESPEGLAVPRGR